MSWVVRQQDHTCDWLTIISGAISSKIIFMGDGLKIIEKVKVRDEKGTSPAITNAQMKTEKCRKRKLREFQST